MARPFYEKHGYTVFTTLKKANGYIDYSLVKYLDKDAPNYVPTNNSGKLILPRSGKGLDVRHSITSLPES